MTPKERDAEGLPSAPDIRAADIAQALLMGGRPTAARVNGGIRSITAEAHPTRDTRVDAAVELILRPWLAGAAELPPARVQARRAAMQRVFRLPAIPEQENGTLWEGLPDSPLNLEQLRDTALKDARTGDGETMTEAQVELGIKAAYYMVLAEPMALRREQVGRLEDAEVDKDNRALSVVLRTMMSSSRGCRQAYAAVVDGRRGGPILEVDRAGRRTKDAAGGPVVLTDQLVRSTYGGAPRPSAAATGPAAAKARWTELLAAVEDLVRRNEALFSVKAASGRPLVADEGWPEGEVGPVLLRLGRVERSLGALADRWQELHEQDEDGDADD
ncbi:MAG: hypothetical protein LC789_13465 [Actinobacteria bacterium]|nr:hypothetical protein [Actinomycetota bacterium]